MKIVRSAALLLFALAPALARAEARAAVAAIDITPPVGSPMAGYAARRGVAKDVHDPLLAKLLLLDDGADSVALITFDLRRLASEKIIEGIKQLGIGHVILASSHTHSGPNADDPNFPTPEDSYRASVESRVVAMAKEAKAKMFAARVGVGAGAAQLGHNRRLVQADGSVAMLWRNEERTPTHPVDPTVGVIRIDDAEGRPRAALVHYACHAVVLGPDNLSISADYPGAMRRHLAEAIRAELGADVEVFFLQGAAGDINPFKDKQPVDQGGFDETDRAGKELADAALPVYRGLKKNLAPVADLHVAEESLSFENRWKPEERVIVNLTTILFDKSAAFVAVPGEPFVEFQLALRARSPVDPAFLLGYAVSGPHAWPGYIPTLQAATEGGYGAGYNTDIEPGAGETLVDHAVINIYRLLGMFEPKPEAE